MEDGRQDMKIKIVSPTKAFLSDYDNDEFQSVLGDLTYTNTSIQHSIKRHYSNFFWKNRNPVGWENHLDTLKKQLKVMLVFQEDGKYYIRPGSIPYLTNGKLEIENLIHYPEPKKMAWKNPPKFTPHPYQEESFTKLVEVRHGNVSLCTGSGKSFIILKLARELGLKTCVVVPSKSIFKELIANFEEFLGKGKIGALGDGKRSIGKQITIAIADSLVNLEPGTEEGDFFHSMEVFLADESHTLPSETLEAVCHGVFQDVPYRFFFSATQTRNDGALPLLHSIIGKTVCSLTTEEAESYRLNLLTHHSSPPTLWSKRGNIS